MSAEEVQLPSQSQSALSALQPCSQSSLPALAPTPASVQSGTPAPTESDETDDLMLRWEDHHKSFFELAEDLCHQEQFIDVTISCGEHNFPAHKLILSVCSPYFKNLFLRNPCKHPIVVLKDVQFKYMKLLLIFMYRGEVAVPQEDLTGLLKTARSLQVRGLSEMHSPTPAQISPRKRYLSEMLPDSDLESRDGEFSLDEVKTRLCGQLEIQAVRGGSPSSAGTPPLPTWLSERVKYLPASSVSSSHLDDISAGHRSSRSESGPSEDEPHSVPHSQFKREADWSTSDNGSDDPRDGRDVGRKHLDKPGDVAADRLVNDYNIMLKKDKDLKSLKLDYGAMTKDRKPANVITSSSSLIDAARAAGLDIPPASSDPMSSISALLAAAQATGGLPPSCTNNAGGKDIKPPLTSTAASVTSAAASQGLDLSNPQSAMANVNAQMQLYYYMQKLQTAGMGNPKERKECPICGKTLYDRSTWNRHMRIHTGEKPYPCRFCGRRFRTNYNKLGHEKKCPDRHARAISGQHVSSVTPDSPSVNVPPVPAQVPNVVYR